MRIISKGAIASSISAGGGAFSPDDISGLQAWWDFSSDDYLTLTSTSIDQCDDRSGNSRHMKQSVAVEKPVRTAAALNGLGCATFDGSNDELHLDSSFDVTQPCTVFALVQAGNTTTDKYLLSGASSAEHLWYTQYTSRLFANYGSSQNCGNNSYDTSDLLTRFEINGTSSECVNRLVTATGLNFGTNAATFEYMGTQYSPYWNGRVYEILIYDSILSAGDVSNVEGYFSDKWGSGL